MTIFSKLLLTLTPNFIMNRIGNDCAITDCPRKTRTALSYNKNVLSILNNLSLTLKDNGVKYSKSHATECIDICNFHLKQFRKKEGEIIASNMAHLSATRDS